MTLEEKVYLMSGRIKHEEAFSGEVHYNITPYLAGGNERLGLPPVKFCDGPRGVVCGTGKSTCFPVSMLRGAAFDTKLEEDIGHAIGREVRAHGGNLFAGVCINLPYNPGWGRSQETYGEDSFAISQMGSALVRGVLEENVIPCVKHFAFNSMELSRFKCSVDCQRRTEREVYLPHFKDCIDAGAACVMSAYNLYKGVHCGHSDYLLSKILKEEWDFDGFVMSDFNFGIRDTVQAANAGLDMEMCWTYLYGENLVRAVRDGLVHESRIDEAAVRIAKTVLAFEDAYAKSGKVYGEEVLGCKEHKALALTAAREGITLIKNRSVLPLDRAAVKSSPLSASSPTVKTRGTTALPAFTPLIRLRRSRVLKQRPPASKSFTATAATRRPPKRRRARPTRSSSSWVLIITTRENTSSFTAKRSITSIQWGATGFIRYLCTRPIRL